MRKINSVLAVIFALLFLHACGGEDETTSDNTEPLAPAVEVVQAQYGALPLEERLNGLVRAANQVDIYPRIGAPIEEVFVEDGDQVSEGDPLLKLRDTEFNEQLRQAEAALRINIAQRRQAQAALGEIESELKREQILADRDLSSDLEIERLEAQKESAEASLELANAQIAQAESLVDERREALDRTIVRAPVSGTVGGRMAEVGMQATTGERLFTIGDLSNSEITINLTEQMLGYIETGQTVRIFSENLGDTVLTAEISRISPFLGAGNFSTEAEIDIDNDSGLLLPGMFVTVDVLYGESEQATIVPLSAIYRNPRSGETGIYVATSYGMESEIVEELDEVGEPLNLSNPTDVEFKSIEVIARGRDAAGVTGVRSGDWVVTVGQNLIDRDNSSTARVRPKSWRSIVEMQRLQPQDLLREIMEQNVADRSTMNGQN
jgi:RND family efflux transporter MFP subunit